MKKFILRILLFCLLPLPLLYVGAHLVDKGLKKSHYFYYAEWNDLFDGKINADLLVFGTSRAWVQFAPAILDSSLHLNSYNLGMDGAPFDIQYERFKIYLRHNKKPKYILQEVGYNATFIPPGGLPHFEQFLPYYDDTAIWRMVSHFSLYPVGVSEHYFPMYKYNNQFPLIKEGLFSYFGRGTKNTKYKGYEGRNWAWDSSFHTFKNLYPEGKIFELDRASIALFKEYLAFCRSNDIQVVMVFPPAFYQVLPYVKKLWPNGSTARQCF